MLANFLAVLLGLGSFTFYMAAFFYPEVHRRTDALWSGLGLLYAAVLWFCASQITGIVLLGQLAAVVLLLGLGWQALTVRRQKTPVYQQTPIVITPEVVGGWAKNTLNQLRIAPPEPVPVRLEKRSLSKFSYSQLGTRLDPRRRTVYEYEFVEDGILEQSPLKPLLDDQELALELSPEVDTATNDLDYTAPPSAEAEVLSVEVPAAKVPAMEAVVLDVPVAEPEAVTLAADSAETGGPDAEREEVREVFTA